MQQMEQQAQASSMGIEMAGMVIGAAGAAITAAFAIAAKTAIDFDKNMHNVNSIARLSVPEFKAVEKAVLDMSTRLPQTIDELSKGLYDVYSSGFQGKTAMEVLETAAMGASAGLADTATSSRALMAVMNAYNQKTGPDAKRIMDIMFMTVNKGVLTFEELASSVGDVVSTSATAKIPFEQIGAAFATMTLSGINADEAATSLNQAILHMIKPMDSASKMAESLGLTWLNARDGAKHLQEVGLAKALDEIRVATHGDIGEIAQLLPEVRGLKGVLSLTKNGGKDFNDMLVAMQNASGETKKALEEQGKAIAFQWQLVTNTVSAFVTEGLLPLGGALSWAIGILQSVASWLTKQPEWLKAAALGYVGLTAAIVVGIGALMTYGATMGIVTRGMAAFTAQAGLAAGAVGVLSTALKWLSIIGIVATLFTVAYKAGEWLVTTFHKIGEWVAYAASALGILGVVLAVIFLPISTLVAILAGLAAALIAVGAAWTKYGDKVKSWLGLETKQTQEAGKNADKIKQAEEQKKAAKEGTAQAAEQATAAEAKQLREEQSAAIARSALYLADQQARQILTDAIKASSQEQIKAFDDAQQKFYAWVSIFDKVPEKIAITGQELLARLQDQVTWFAQWADNIKILSGRVPPEMLAELRKLGPQAAGQIEALKNMSEPELAQYVELWRQKHAQVVEGSKAELAAGAPQIAAQAAATGKASTDGLASGVANPDARDHLSSAIAETHAHLRSGAEQARDGGAAIGAGWVLGIVDILWASVNPAYGVITRAIRAVKALLGNSLPTKGPLVDPKSGGLSIGQEWVRGISEAIASARLDLAPVQTLLLGTGPTFAFAGGSGGGGIQAPQASQPNIMGATHYKTIEQHVNIYPQSTTESASAIASRLSWELRTRGY